MKIIIEFELEKPQPLITDLIANRIYMLECVDKKKDVTVSILEEENECVTNAQ